MLHAYLDESGRDDGPVYVMAGFIGTDSQWDEFVPEWKAGLGKKDHLHTKELRLGSPRGRTRHSKMLSMLGPIPRKHGLKPIAGFLSTKAYDQSAGTMRQFAPKYKPWFLCFQHILIQLIYWLPKDETLKLTFEYQGEFSEFLLKVWGIVKLKNPKRCERILDIGFIDKNASYFTEPGDYYAYAVRDYISSFPKQSEIGKVCSPILGDLDADVIGGEYTPNEMRAHSRRIATNTLISFSRRLK